MTKAFSLIEVVKTYPGFQLGPLNLELEPGTVLGYIGPNASGKTTTFHCMAGITRPRSGKIEVFGCEASPHVPKWRLDIGYVGDIHAFYEGWTGEANLAFRSRFYPNWSQARAVDLAKRFDLPLDVKAGTLSTGNRVKLSLVAALAHSPKLLLLDEPTSGLDPVVRREVLDTLFEALEGGERAIFYATHILSDIGRLADSLAFLRAGRITQVSAKDDLLDKWRSISFRYSGSGPKIAGAEVHESEGTSHRVISSDQARTMEQLQAMGAENIESARMTIDDIAVQILKGGQNVAGD
ncbi:MAG TPA: ABC transporter ATP-binding protein [bacterium]|nr:ABC transporter ATP-binding protein [bacterium]